MRKIAFSCLLASGLLLWPAPPVSACSITCAGGSCAGTDTCSCVGGSPICTDDKICGIEDVPAATLLLPYFEVDLPNPNGRTTLFSINNASADDVVVIVQGWSDLSVKVFNFAVHLTGFDVQTINLRDVMSGILPRTGTAAPFPFPGCVGVLPPPRWSAAFIAHVQAALTGRASPVTGLASGRFLGDNVARGYVTVDNLNYCGPFTLPPPFPVSLLGPCDAGYFQHGVGNASNENVLWGDYIYVDPGQNFAQGETLVHIEASATNPETSAAGEYTFYGRCVAWNASDNREPLSTNFATRYANNGSAFGGTTSSLVVWRDPKVEQGEFAFPAMPGRPPWFPLNQENIVVFDEEENFDVPQGIRPFPAAAQRTKIGGAAFPVTFDFGWLFLNLNTAGANPPQNPDAAQAWVTVTMDGEGRFSVGFDAIQLDTACNARHTFP